MIRLFVAVATILSCEVATDNVSESTVVTPLNVSDLTVMTPLNVSASTIATFVNVTYPTVVTPINLSDSTVMIPVNVSDSTVVNPVNMTYPTVVTSVNVSDSTVVTYVNFSDSTVVTPVNVTDLTALTPLNKSDPKEASPENFSDLEVSDKFISNKSCDHSHFLSPISELLLGDSNYTENDVLENNIVCVCHLSSCFLKCCPEGFSSSKNKARTCVPDNNNSFSLSNYKGGSFPSDYTLRFGFPCNEAYWNAEYIELLPNGSLVTSNDVLNPGQFCLEYSHEKNKSLPFTCYYASSNDDSDDRRYVFYPFGMLLSIPFLLATVIVYAIIPDLRDTRHGMSFMCHMGCLIIGYIDLAIIQLDTSLGLYFKFTTCTILGYIMQFAFLATFFWMNVMCFDIWWTFSSLKKPGGSVRERDLKKFLLYSVYAWGCPLLILTATLVADFTPLLSIHNKFKPQMGIDKCFFKTAASTWLYMYGPIAVLIVANLIMFGFTAKKIFLHTRETQVLKSEDSKRHDSKDRERFNLYLKLFIVMGVNWVAELVSWTFNSQSNIWYITDITNTLQGLIIFIIFVCKPRVLRLLEAAVCPGRAEKRRNATNSSSRSRNTTTSVINGSARVVHSPETMKLKTHTADDSDSNM